MEGVVQGEEVISTSKPVRLDLEEAMELGSASELLGVKVWEGQRGYGTEVGGCSRAGQKSVWLCLAGGKVERTA